MAGTEGKIPEFMKGLIEAAKVDVKRSGEVSLRKRIGESKEEALLSEIARESLHLTVLYGQWESAPKWEKDLVLAKIKGIIKWYKGA